MAITEKVYVKNRRHLSAQLDTHIPRSVFSGATLDVLFGAETLAELDEASRERILAFAEDFMDCDCQSAPYCGCPERKFVTYLLDLRREGLGPEAIVDVIEDEYMVAAYPGDVRSFLDESIRTLEAAAALADVEGATEQRDRLRRYRDELVG